MRFVPRFTVVTVLCLWLASIAGATIIYVDSTNAGDPGMDGTLAHPWDTIAKGAADLAIKNGVSQGGHVVRVAAGTYNEEIDLDDTHSGLGLAPNVFLAVGNVTVDGNPQCFDLLTTDCLTISGFDVYNGSLYGIKADNVCTNILITNCVVRKANVAGIYSGQNAGSSDLEVRNCTVWGAIASGIYARGRATIVGCNVVCNGGGGIYAYYSSVMSVSNCIVMGNGERGVYKVGNTVGKLTAEYNCIFGNGWVNVYDPMAECGYNTAAEINSIDNLVMYCANNIVANPGFPHPGTNWDFTEVYAGSPVLNAGQGGVNMGRYPSLSTVPVSANTYYVDSVAGNDGRSPAQAQDANTPWLTIGRAACSVVAGDTVVVQSGNYEESVLITNSGGYQSPITFQANGSVLVTNNGPIKLSRVSSITLDGFTCGGGGFYNGYGIRADYSCVLTITNCECFGACSLWYENPGVYFYYSPANLVTHSRLHGNNTGVYSRYAFGGTLESCVICSNKIAVNNGSHGYGIYSAQGGWQIQNCNVFANEKDGVYLLECNNAPSMLKNCTIVSNGNSAVSLGSGSDMTMVNSILMGSAYGVREENAASDGTNMYCCFFCNSTNFLEENTTPLNTVPELNSLDGFSNNIVANPVFREINDSDYRLGNGSPCVDAGTPTTDLTTDMFGNPRLVGPAVDIGIYEMPAPGTIFCFD